MLKGIRVLVVDDEDVVCKSCKAILKEEGCEVTTAYSSSEALRILDGKDFDAVIADLKMPGSDGITLFRKIKERSPSVAGIIMTGYSSIETAVDAIKSGAFDYIPKPFTPDQLTTALLKAVENERSRRANIQLVPQLEEGYKFGDIVGGSKKMREVYAVIQKVAPTDCTVLIYGESGTGKELIAKAIHSNSLRSEEQFVSVDCTALTESLLESELFGHVKGSFTGAVVSKPGLFEVANGGTFFLDEIGNITLPIQSKLLRVLQEREYKPVGGTETKKTDIRLITATNKNLEAMIAEEIFREELFYRLNVVPIFLPPLRKRREDIPALVHHFLEKYRGRVNGKETLISPAAMDLLVQYQWPGNVREVENVVERLVVMTEGSVIEPQHLTVTIQGRRTSGEIAVPRTNAELKKVREHVRHRAIRDVEKAFVTDALKRNDWNVTRAAEEVGMQRTNFHALMRKYALATRKERV